MTDDEIADSAFIRELHGIESEIRALESDITVLMRKRQNLLTGETAFKNFVKASIKFDLRDIGRI